ncbi:probable LRR receptor-like serine/threonine-protein kinase At5g63710 isoform X2 [Corylus avellana]|nr:probable LRR receptor-like serine/threonine-protein kinase At5g63710 isoform X2 [Corylus avellana]
MKVELICSGYRYYDTSGVSGEIPQTFANLLNLCVMNIQGNSFEGSIPSTSSKLTSLKGLSISDLSNGSSSLAFNVF